LARNGIDFATATLGTATTADHLNRLFRITDNVVFCFDGDRAGQAAAWRALENALPQIREGRQIRFVFLPDGHDPDSYVNELGADAFVAAVDNGVALSDYLIRELASQVDMDTVDGKARLAEMAKPLVNRIPPGVYRELLIDRLGDSVGLSATKLGKMLEQADTGSSYASGQAKVGRANSARPAMKAGQPSVVRRAITLLLNEPRAGDNLDIEKLAGLSRPGIDLLQSLIETVQAEPNITTAGLLERWRHHDQGRHLGKLAAVEMPAGDEFDTAGELAACLDQLALAGRRERIDFLIEKQRLNPLTEEEKSELRQIG
jgi:DNA primase